MRSHEKVLITTSRRPTRRIRTFCNDLARCIPNSIRINRGKLNREGIAEKALELDAERIVIINRWKGGPGKLELFHVSEGLVGVPPLIYVRGIKLQREFGFRKLGRFRSLAITASFSHGNDEIKKLADALSRFLNIPFILPNEKLAGYDLLMHISKNVSEQLSITFFESRLGREIGPRITLSHLIWNLRKER